VSELDAIEDYGDSDFLAERIGGFICGDLDEGIRVAASGKKVRWDRLANWNELNNLRDALDMLPEFPSEDGVGAAPVARSKHVILYGPHDCPVVYGKKKPPLTFIQYKLVKMLIEAGENGCTKSQLTAVSSDFWRVLKKLQKQTGWDRAIQFPGRPHGRYIIE
jgi:hypothetical protein